MSKVQVNKPLCRVNISARGALATMHDMHHHVNELTGSTVGDLTVHGHGVF